jgi:tetratricopeptide (TPR) repeat protein
MKQLDAVLRRRDLRLDDNAVPGIGLEVAKALGATDLISGAVSFKGSEATVSAKRIKVADGSTAGASEATGPRRDLAKLAQFLARDLLGATELPPPITMNEKALEGAARCEIVLARQSLGAHSHMTLKPDKIAEAEKECRDALKADPKLGLARAGLSVVLAARGKYDEARKEAAKALDDRFIPFAVLAEAFAARKANDSQAWTDILASAVDERPGFLHALGYLAEDRMEQGDDKEALNLFNRYLERSPDHTWAMGKKSREMAKLGQLDEAIALAEKALTMNPGDPELLIETASRYIDAGRDAKAEPLLKQAMDSKPPRPLAALRLGYLYIRTHRLPQAKDALEKCVQMAVREDEARTRGIAHADLARVAAKQNRYPDAVSELQKARSEGNNKLPCDEPELSRWKERPELKQVCVEAAAKEADEHTDDDAVPVDL